MSGDILCTKGICQWLQRMVFQAYSVDQLPSFMFHGNEGSLEWKSAHRRPHTVYDIEAKEGSMFMLLHRSTACVRHGVLCCTDRETATWRVHLQRGCLNPPIPDMNPFGMLVSRYITLNPPTMDMVLDESRSGCPLDCLDGMAVDLSASSTVSDRIKAQHPRCQHCRQRPGLDLELKPRMVIC